MRVRNIFEVWLCLLEPRILEMEKCKNDERDFRILGSELKENFMELDINLSFLRLISHNDQKIIVY